MKLFYKREREGSQPDSERPRQPPAHMALHLIMGVYNHLVCGFSNKNERLRLSMSHVAIILFNTVLWPTLHQALHKPEILHYSLYCTRDTSPNLLQGVESPISGKVAIFPNAFQIQNLNCLNSKSCAIIFLLSKCYF